LGVALHTWDPATHALAHPRQRRITLRLHSQRPEQYYPFTFL
jgi:hypothetical protein